MPFGSHRLVRRAYVVFAALYIPFMTAFRFSQEEWDAPGLDAIWLAQITDPLMWLTCYCLWWGTTYKSRHPWGRTDLTLKGPPPKPHIAAKEPSGQRVA